MHKRIGVKKLTQEYKHGCSITCIAMITKEDVKDIAKKFGNNFEKSGIQDDDVIDYISNKGYSVIEKAATGYSKLDFHRDELLRPFAPAHLVKVKLKADSGLFHWVVMTSKGKFICPMGWSDKEIKDSYAIVKVVGIYKE